MANNYYDSMYSVTGKRFFTVRTRLNLTQGDVATEIGMGQVTLSNWESEPPAQVQWLARLAQKYNVSADYLLGLIDDPGGRRELAIDEQQLLSIWRNLDEEQRQYVLDTLAKLQRWSQPRIIGETND